MPPETEARELNLVRVKVQRPDWLSHRAILVLPPLDATPRRLIMADPEATAVLEPKTKEDPQIKEIPLEEEPSTKKRIKEGVLGLLSNSSENTKTMAAIVLFDLDPQVGTQAAQQRILDTAGRLKDRYLHPDSTDPIELMVLTRLFNKGLNKENEERPQIQNTKRIAQHAQSTALWGLKGGLFIYQTGLDRPKIDIDDWWNRTELTWNVAKDLSTDEALNLKSSINPDFFRVVRSKFEAIRDGKQSLSLSEAAYNKVIVPGMAMVPEPGYTFFSPEHALVKIAATVSLVSKSEFAKLRITPAMIKHWEDRLEAYSDREKNMSDPKKVLKLADFQISLDQVKLRISRDQMEKQEADQKIRGVIKVSKIYQI